MTADDRIRWDRRYREGAYAARNHPAVFLQERLPHIDVPEADTRALDLACGSGRNALFLARRGFHVDAVDISPEALLRGYEAGMAQDIATNMVAANRIEWIQQDLDDGPPMELMQGEKYDLILIMRYLDLSLVQAALHLLKPDGHLLCEVHLQTGEEVTGPRSASFRAAPGELQKAAAGLQILFYQEGLVQEPDGETACVARLHARQQSE